jgi:hypothetical protein
MPTECSIWSISTAAPRRERMANRQRNGVASRRDLAARHCGGAVTLPRHFLAVLVKFGAVSRVLPLAPRPRPS